MKSLTFRDVRNNHREHTVTDTELDAFARQHISDSDLRSRISYVFLADLLLMEQRAGTAPAEIMRAVRQLEAGDLAPGTKPASRFRHLPLRGLWHKHYFCARFYGKNLAIGWSAARLEKMLREELPKIDGELITKEIIQRIAKRFSEEPYVERHEKQKLTGEWLVFMKHAGINHYLCLATHTSQAEDGLVFHKAKCAAMHHGPEWEAWFTEATGLSDPD